VSPAKCIVSLAAPEAGGIPTQRIPLCRLRRGPPFRHRFESLFLRTKRTRRHLESVLLTVPSRPCVGPLLWRVSCVLASRPSGFVPMASFPACSIRNSRLLDLEKKWFLPPRGSRGGDWRGRATCRSPETTRWLCSRSSTSAGLGSLCIPSCKGYSSTSWRFRTSIPTLSCTWHASSPCVRRSWGLTPTRSCGSTSSVVLKIDYS
jgi:hypothetical protein